MAYNPYIHGTQRPMTVGGPALQAFGTDNQPPDPRRALGGQPLGSTGYQVASATQGALRPGTTAGAVAPAQVPLINPSTVAPGLSSAAVTPQAAGALGALGKQPSSLAALQAMLTPKTPKDDPTASLWNRRQDPRRAQMLGMVDAGLEMMQAKPGESALSAIGKGLRTGFKTSEAVRAQRIGEKTKAEELVLKRIAALAAMTKAMDTSTDDIKEWNKLFPNWQNDPKQKAALLKYQTSRGATNIDLKVNTKDKQGSVKRYTDEVNRLTTIPSSDTLTDTTMMLDLLEGGMRAGPREERLLGLRTGLSALGLLSEEETANLSEQEIFSKISKRRVLDLTAKLKGALSDKELSFITEAANKLGDQPDALKLMLHYTRIGLQRQSKRRDAIFNWELSDQQKKIPSNRDVLRFARKWEKENTAGSLKDELLAEMKVLQRQIPDPTQFSDALRKRYGALGEEIWFNRNKR